MTWEIIAALIAIITVGIAIGKVISNLSQTLTKLNCSVDALNDTLTRIDRDNEKAHTQFNKDIKTLYKKEEDHELRIRRFEDNLK